MVNLVRWLAFAAITSKTQFELQGDDANKVAKSISRIGNNAESEIASTKAKTCYIVTPCVCLSTNIIKAIGSPPNFVEANREATALWIKTTGELKQQEKINNNRHAMMETKTHQQCHNALLSEKQNIGNLIIYRDFVCKGLESIIEEIRETEVFLPGGSDDEIFAAKPTIKQIPPRQCHSMTSGKINEKIEKCQKYAQDFKENNLYGTPDEIKENNEFINRIHADLAILKIVATESNENIDDILANLRRNCGDDNQDIYLAHGNSATLTFSDFMRLITRLKGHLESLKTWLQPTMTIRDR